MKKLIWLLLLLNLIGTSNSGYTNEVTVKYLETESIGNQKGVGQLGCPMKVVSNQNGELYVLEIANNGKPRLQKFDRNEKFIKLLALPYEIVDRHPRKNWPVLEIDLEGNIYTALNNQIWKITKKERVEQVLIKDKFVNLIDLTVDDEGNLYILEEEKAEYIEREDGSQIRTHQYKVKIYDSMGNYKAPFPADDLKQPTKIKFNKFSGHIYILDKRTDAEIKTIGIVRNDSTKLFANPDKSSKVIAILNAETIVSVEKRRGKYNKKERIFYKYIKTSDGKEGYVIDSWRPQDNNLCIYSVHGKILIYDKKGNLLKTIKPEDIKGFDLSFIKNKTQEGWYSNWEDIAFIKNGELLLVDAEFYDDNAGAMWHITQFDLNAMKIKGLAAIRYRGNDLRAGRMDCGSTTGIEIREEEILFADGMYLRILDFEGTEKSKFGLRESKYEFNQPLAITIDRENNLYIADRRLNQVIKYDKKRNFKFRFGGYGEDSGKFNRVGDLVADNSGNIFIVDVLNRRVQKFDKNGLFVRSFEKLGNISCPYNIHFDIGIDNKGNLVICSDLGATIQKYTQKGDCLFKHTMESKDRNEYYTYAKIDDFKVQNFNIDQKGNLWIIGNEKGKRYITKCKYGKSGITISEKYYFSPQPQKERRWIKDFTLNAVWITESGEIYFLMGTEYGYTEDNTIYEIGEDGKIAKIELLSKNGENIIPIDIAVDSHGKLWVIDTRNYCIRKFVKK